MKTRGIKERRTRPQGVSRLLLALCLLAACGQTKLPPSDAAARIESDELPYRAFEDYLKLNVGADQAELSATAMSRLFDQFLDEELIYRLSVDEGFATDKTPRRQATEAILAKTLSDIPQSQVETYYELNRAEFERPERVRLRQILVEERRQAEEAMAALKAGEDFAEVANRLSLDPSSAEGGEQGELSQGDLPPAFAEMVFSLAPGEISPIVAAEYGFHIFQVTEKLPAETAELAQVEAEIRSRLYQARADTELANLLHRARDRYNVEIYERNLPFEYRGGYLAANHRAL
ncbi:MAG: peptidyl-prolyl cis-trans isomerase [Acidobacteria bacterium]|nr:peptidyl-prolyl cis-trans isomerase [Acidobacteriota bacterium]